MPSFRKPSTVPLGDPQKNRGGMPLGHTSRSCSPVPVCLEWVIPPLPLCEWVSLFEPDELIQVEQCVEENTAHLDCLWLQKILRTSRRDIWETFQNEIQRPKGI